MTNSPGWYPDQRDRDSERYWTGTEWSAGTRPATGPRPPATRGSRHWLYLAIAAVLLVAVAAWSLYPKDQPNSGDGAGATSTKPWDELSEPPGPEHPVAMVKFEATATCQQATDLGTPEPVVDDIASGGGLTMPVPEGWEAVDAADKFLAGQVTMVRTHEGSNRSDVAMLGGLPATGSAEETAHHFLQCYLQGRPTHPLRLGIVEDYPNDVEARKGHWVQAFAEYADDMTRVDVVAVETAKGEFGIYLAMLTQGGQAEMRWMRQQLKVA